MHKVRVAGSSAYSVISLETRGGEADEVLLECAGPLLPSYCQLLACLCDAKAVSVVGDGLGKLLLWLLLHATLLSSVMSFNTALRSPDWDRQAGSLIMSFTTAHRSPDWDRRAGSLMNQTISLLLL